MLYRSMRLNVIVDETARPLLPNDSQSEIQEWFDQPGRVCAQGYAAGDFYWMRWPGLAAFCFNQTESVIVYPEKSLSESFISDLFQRSVYPLILQSKGIEVLHASGIYISKGVIAFCADAGTGKSTLAYSLAQRGYPIWADDAVTFELIEDTFVSCKLPFNLRLLPDTAAYLGEINPQEIPQTLEPGAELDFTYKPLAAVCILNRDASNSLEILQVKRSEAFTSLLLHAYYYATPDPAHKQTMLKNYLDLVGRIPIYKINFKPGFEYIDILLKGIDRFIDEFAQ